MTFFYCTTDQVHVLSISSFSSIIYAPFWTLNTRIHSFPHFTLACIEILSSNFAYDFVLLYYRSRVSSICVNFCGSYAPFELRILEIHSFPHFYLTCFDILSWNFAYDFVLLYYRSSLSVVNLRRFLWELCSFWILEYWKYTVFHTFSYTLWHIEIKFFTWLCLMYYRSRMSSLCVCLVLRASTHFSHDFV